MPETTAAVDRASADVRLTRSARDILERAVEAASHRNTTEATPLDVLRSLLGMPDSLAVETIRALGIDPATVAVKLGADGEASSLPLRQLVVNANREAQVLGHYQVDSIHLLLALMYADARPTAAILQSSGLTLYDVRRQMQSGKATAAPERALRRRPWPRLRPVLGISRIFIALLALLALTGASLWFDVLPGVAGVTTIAFVVVGWVVSVCVHEFFHAVAAYLGGDRDVAASGYLTLNPLRYTNVVMSIVLPVAALLLGGIGLPGGAVYVNHTMLRSRVWDSAVSLAGPLANVLFALVIAGFLAVAPYLAGLGLGSLSFYEALAFLGYLQVVAIILNLLPIPPLDGFGILRPWLPYSVQDAGARIGMAGYLVLFFLLFYVPALSGLFFGAADVVSASIGIDPGLAAYGYAHMRFR